MERVDRRKKLNKRKIVAGICIMLGIALLAVPFYYHFRGQEKTDMLLAEFEQTLEEGESEETGEVGQGEQTTSNEEKKALLEKNEAIGIIEIEAIGIRYPIVEGSGKSELAYAIGHISETASIGEKGNCVLAGHNGSRNGAFFTDLNQIRVGDVVILTDKNGIEHEYEVSKTFVIEPYDNSIKNQMDNEEVTLLTCAENGTKRFVCKCSLKMEVEE